MNASKRSRILLAILFAVLLVSGLVAAARHSPQTVYPAPVAPKAVVGVPTGEFDLGRPVYRLPTVEVTVSRSEELARIAREEAMAAK
jgi:energy-converting hydrogenase Eha subunit F